MGFFVKAAVEALKRFPSVNASIDGSDIVYHGYQDVGVAVSTDRGLVVPVLRNAENMSIANIENGIYDYAMKARDGKLTIDEMTGGTFHHHQWWCLRFTDLNANYQPTTVSDSGYAQDSRAPSGS